MKRINSVWQGQGGYYRFTRQHRVNLLRVGKPASIGKEDSAEFRGSIFPDLLGSFYMSPFHFPGSHSFPINAVTSIVHSPQS